MRLREQREKACGTELALAPRMRWVGLILVLGVACGGGERDTVTTSDGSVPDTDGGPGPGPGPGPVICDGGPCPPPSCTPPESTRGGEGDALGELAIGEMRDGGFREYVADGDATYVWGFQGGTMIQPVIEVPIDLAREGDCVEITLEHRPDPRYPDEAGEIESFPRYVYGTRMMVGGSIARSMPAMDQIGWSAPDGVRMILSVSARGETWRRTAEVALRIVDEDGWDECDVIPEEQRFGCSHQVITGTLAVDTVGAPEGTGCEALVDVGYTVTPEATLPEGCFEPSRTIRVHQSCIDFHAIAPGATFDGTMRLGADEASCPSELPFQAYFCDCTP